MPKKFKLTKSLKLFKEALKILPAGASSNARLWMHAQFCPTYAPCTIFAKRANGAYIWDVDGNKYIDYRLGFGPVILGHSYPAVVKRIHAAEEDGSIYALDNELELIVAKKIRKLVPSAEMIRYSVTGTEATMHAIRLARAYTNKNVILKFEGHYHGAHDYLLFSTHPSYEAVEGKPIVMSRGIPKEISKLVIVERWNDFDAVEKTVKANYKKLAAIITEPVMGNAAAIPPKPGYLKFLRELCDRYGILLIFDEVKTGFRIAPGGAQQYYKVTPDISTFAKSLSNGYPLSAITGPEEIMKLFGPGVERVTHGGTYASNPISLIAADATLDVLKKASVWKHLYSFGKKLMAGMQEIFNENKMSSFVQGLPTMFQFVCTTKKEVTNYRDLCGFCDFGLYSRIQFELMKEGVLVDEDNQECWYTSLSHGKKELEKTLDALDVAIKRARTPRPPLQRFPAQAR
jgi:glutamate-1-semialdehyde 2,1-aminomutase